MVSNDSFTRLIRRNSESARGADRAAILRCSPIILSNYFKSRGFLENKRRAWGAERNGLKRNSGENQKIASKET